MWTGTTTPPSFPDQIKKHEPVVSAIGACFAISVYLLDKINDRLPEWLGVGVMLVVAFYFSLGGRAIVKAETLDG